MFGEEFIREVRPLIWTQNERFLGRNLLAQPRG